MNLQKELRGAVDHRRWDSASAACPLSAESEGTAAADEGTAAADEGTAAADEGTEGTAAAVCSTIADYEDHTHFPFFLEGDNTQPAGAGVVVTAHARRECPFFPSEHPHAAAVTAAVSEAVTAAVTRGGVMKHGVSDVGTRSIMKRGTIKAVDTLMAQSFLRCAADVLAELQTTKMSETLQVTQHCAI